MPKTIEVRSLLQENIKEINVEENISNLFKTWCEMFVKKTNREPTLIDVFYAGYVLSNPNVKDMFRIKIKERAKDDFN